MIEIKNISHTHGKKPVLKNISLNIQEGKITGLIGANGAGKSTLFSIVAGLTKQSDGSVLIDGQDTKSLSIANKAKMVSILRQSSSVKIRITVRELVEYGRYPHSKGRMSKTDIEKVDEAIKYMQLENIQDRYIDTLSGGQRQRVYIAMVIAQDTKYILLDEPLNNLDMRYTTEMMNVLKDLVENHGKTIVIVLHDINCASAYCDSIVAMKNGEIIKEGCADCVIAKEVLDDIYSHDFHIEKVKDKLICLYK